MLETFCPHFNQSHCRSCTWIELDYAAQVARKEERVREALGFFPSVALEPSFKSALQGFRNRAKMTVTGTAQAPVIGLTGVDALDRGRELLDCPIHHPRLNELLAAVPEWIRQGNLIPYNIESRKGELKGLIAFYSPQSDQMYLRFVLRSRECVLRIKKLLPDMRRRFPSLVCVSANLQPIPHAILEGPEEIVLSDKAFIEHRLGEVVLNLAPQAFVQTNVEVATALYRTAATWIGRMRPERMLELFCGQGAFAFFASESAARVVGVEINAEAVRTANATAEALGLKHLQFRCADATRLGAEILELAPDLILVNPPRRGLAGGVELIEQALPRHFIYSSCHLETLAKDLKRLSSAYHLRKVQLFDMFPHTEHFETLVALERRG